MCLAIPGVIIEISEDQKEARVDYNGISRWASLRLCPQATVGDYVLVHAGFLIQVLSAEEGKELAELAKEVDLL